METLVIVSVVVFLAGGAGVLPLGWGVALILYGHVIPGVIVLIVYAVVVFRATHPGSGGDSSGDLGHHHVSNY